jgi:hypothetical protein
MTTRPGYVWDGGNDEWVEIGQAAVLAPVKYQATAPSSPATGDIWIDSDDEAPGITSSLNYRWRRIATGGETSLSGNDSSGLPLAYNPGYEQVYLNGVLQYRGSDYVATTGNTITGLTALVANDTIEVLSFVTAPIGDTYTQTAADAKFATTVNFPAGDWLTWTPILTGTTTNPNIGSTGSNIGRYQVFGKTVHWNITIISGGTGIATGSGQYELSLPVTAKFAQYRSIGSTWQYLDNPNIFGTGTAYLSSATKMSAVMERNYWNSGNFEWATGGQVFSASGTYEAA